MPYDDKPKSASKGNVQHRSSGLGGVISPYGPVTNNVVYHQKFVSADNCGQQLEAYEALFDGLTDNKERNEKFFIKLAGKYKFIDDKFLDLSPEEAKFLALEEMRLRIGALRETAGYKGKKDDVTTFRGIKMRGADLGVFAQGILDKHEIEFAKRQIAFLEEMKAKLTDPTEIDKYNQAIKSIQVSIIDISKLDIQSRQQNNKNATNTATEENPSEA